MKTHEKKPNSIDHVTEYNSTIDVTALKNSIKNEVNEYRRKLELGRKVKEIVHELHMPTASMDRGEMEALELFENRGQVKEIILKKDVPTGCLDRGEMEALELFENQGQVEEIKAVEWNLGRGIC